MEPKIYTRTGDGGSTAHPSGQKRVSKFHPHLELAGLFDELNSWLGLARANLDREAGRAATSPEAIGRISDKLIELQTALLTYFPQLFDSAYRSSDKSSPEAITEAVKKLIELTVTLENEIDHLQAPLPPLTSFILPGGSLGGSSLHVARTVCRRTERHLVSLSDEIGASDFYPSVTKFINRLSDYLYAAARAASHACGQDETKVR